MQMDNAKHIFLHDRGLVGRRGAQFAIDNLTPSTVELSLGHNSLQSEGIIHLFASLRSLRSRWRSPTGGQWGLEKLTLSSNGITGEALGGIAEYLMDDSAMKELYLPHNGIEGGEHLEAFAKAVANSSLQVLSLNNNPFNAESLEILLEGLSPSSSPSSTLDDDDDDDHIQMQTTCLPPVTPPSSLPTSNLTFEILNNPRITPPRSSMSLSSPTHSLTDLHLSGCPLKLSGARLIARFLAVPRRVGKLHLLALNNCDLGARGLLVISRAMEKWCDTLQGLQVSSNHAIPEETFTEGAREEGVVLRGDGVEKMLSGVLEEENEVMRGEFRTSNGERVKITSAKRRSAAVGYRIDRSDPDLIIYAGSPSPSPSTTPTTNPSPISLSALPHHRLEMLLEGLSGTVMKTAQARCRRAVERNQELAAATRMNALGLLPLARILLGARKRSDEECGKDVMKELMVEGKHEGNTFRFTDLPTDLVPLILEFAQDRPGILSGKQMKRLLSYAADSSTLMDEARMVSSLARSRLEVTGAVLGIDTYRPPFRPGPGHYGRAEWQTMILESMRSSGMSVHSLGGGRGGLVCEAGTRSGRMDVDGRERERVDGLLEKLGCERWDPLDD